jgi:hypothetical protein
MLFVVFDLAKESASIRSIDANDNYFFTLCRHKDSTTAPKNQAMRQKRGNKMLPPKKHLKPIFCHENIIILYFDSRI